MQKQANTTVCSEGICAFNVFFAKTVAAFNAVGEHFHPGYSDTGRFAGKTLVTVGMRPRTSSVSLISQS